MSGRNMRCKGQVPSPLVVKGEQQVNASLGEGEDSALDRMELVGMNVAV